MPDSRVRWIIHINGIVQGVGFRPFIYNLANEIGLVGCVYNDNQGVCIEVEGDELSLEVFMKRLRSEAPPLSNIKSCIIQREHCIGYTDFSIISSSRKSKAMSYISPDVSVCDDCLKEFMDPKNKRYHYPFINCTNCGPRFSIMKGIPYDREFTTMNEFIMCNDCAIEYSNHLDRRFHAQPIACEDCGPRLHLLDIYGDEVWIDNASEIGNDLELGNRYEVERTIELLLSGKIIAIKGIGGYHLACDARNPQVINELRRRKGRDLKPLALMAKSIEVIERYCELNTKEVELLSSRVRPIVLLKRKKDSELLCNEIASDNKRVGIMLPYTPLQYLLFQESIECLIMTSANQSGEPIVYKDEEALIKLGGIADYFLVHNREIYTRVDDSVTSVFRNKEYCIRRARGYVPYPIDLSFIMKEVTNKRDFQSLSILACGAELKNTFCIINDDSAFLSQHIGDLENYETLCSYEENIEHYKLLFSTNPKVIAYDMHPDYLSTTYANNQIGVTKMQIQHHQAHVASCMAENGLTKSVIGVVFDGTGYGEDGHIWGGEFFVGDYMYMQRAAHMQYVPLPGGDTSIKEPWRTAVSYIMQYFQGDFIKEQFHFLDYIDPVKISILKEQISKKINCPITSSIGRLFDAISSLLGLCNFIDYEGQAAIKLEMISKVTNCINYSYDIYDYNKTLIFSPEKMIREIIEDLRKGEGVGEIAGRFHITLATIVFDICNRLRLTYKINEVVLSGGVFQNQLLLELVVQKLSKNNFKVYTHSMVPTNDGGISLGQAAITLYRLVHSE